MELQKNQGSQLPVAKSTYNQHSIKLIGCLIALEKPELKDDAKMELITMTSGLMPAGKPAYTEMIRYPKLCDLIAEHGQKKMMKAIVLLIKDFCASCNVVRNMNDDQMIEAAAMLIDECGNFRLEDYTLMFSMAKRGILGKIMDRIDLETITRFLDAYYENRAAEGHRKMTEDDTKTQYLGPSIRAIDSMNPADIEMENRFIGISSALSEIKAAWKESPNRSDPYPNDKTDYVPRENEAQ